MQNTKQTKLNFDYYAYLCCVRTSISLLKQFCCYSESFIAIHSLVNWIGFKKDGYKKGEKFKKIHLGICH